MKRPSLSLILQLGILLSALLYRVHRELSQPAHVASAPYTQPHHH